MTRDVYLQSYLPPFMQEYQEIDAALDAENPEFKLVWDAADRTLYNEFIATADEYGISRFEGLLGILPYQEDTLESRRARVFARWFDSLPYTMKMLIERLTVICGENNFTVETDFMHYTLIINTELELFGLTDELDQLLEAMVPCNMIIRAENEISCEADGAARFGSGVCVTRVFVLTNDMSAESEIASSANVGSGALVARAFVITNDISAENDVASAANAGSGTLVARRFVLN